MKRRSLLQMGLGIAGLGLLRSSQASISARKRKMLFLRVPNGWDTTRVFAPEFDNPNVDMEDAAFVQQIGDLRYVSHPDRPSVDQFFSAFSEKTAFLNGIIVPNINHMICNRLIYTANSTGTSPDWATRIAASTANDYPLPHVLISGKAIGGLQSDLIVNVGKNGQLEQLLNGDILYNSDIHLEKSSAQVEEITNQYLQRTLKQQTLPHQSDAFFQSYSQAIERVSLMKSLSSDIRWNTDGSDESQIDLAVDLLLSDLTRCITLEFYRLTFDSHEANTEKQQQNFAELFTFIHQLTSRLASTQGITQNSLLDEVTIIVLSEMGRTPQENTAKGKDHWYHTSGMLIGSGIQGGRSFGGYTDYFAGEKIDPTTGDITDSGVEITPAVLGATILGLADVDPLEELDTDPITGLWKP